MILLGRREEYGGFFFWGKELGIVYVKECNLALLLVGSLVGNHEMFDETRREDLYLSRSTTTSSILPCNDHPPVSSKQRPKPEL